GLQIGSCRAEQSQQQYIAPSLQAPPYAPSLQSPQQPHGHNQPRSSKGGFQCPICLKTFTQKSYLNYHNNIHTGNKPFKCKCCPARYAAASNLKWHMKKCCPSFI
ncbi:unnamed protein product, partial [Owenia fusiformis]